MENTSAFGQIGKTLGAIPWSSYIMIIVLAAIVGYVAYIFLYTPRYPRQQVQSEGFFGGVVRGSGHPDCLRTLNAAAELMNMFLGRTEDNADYRELQLIMSKLACLKKDLMSPSGIVQATLYQPYENAHDREPVAEVTATCLTKTIAPRDLDIIFATWRDRGNFLIKRLCTAVSFSEEEVKKADALFTTAWTDVYEVAKGRCLKSPSELMAEATSPHDAQPYESTDISGREYNGYFSGWMGQI